MITTCQKFRQTKIINTLTEQKGWLWALPSYFQVFDHSRRVKSEVTELLRESSMPHPCANKWRAGGNSSKSNTPAPNTAQRLAFIFLSSLPIPTKKYDEKNWRVLTYLNNKWKPKNIFSVCYYHWHRWIVVTENPYIKLRKPYRSCNVSPYLAHNHFKYNFSCYYNLFKNGNKYIHDARAITVKSILTCSYPYRQLILEPRSNIKEK